VSSEWSQKQAGGGRGRVARQRHRFAAVSLELGGESVTITILKDTLDDLADDVLVEPYPTCENPSRLEASIFKNLIVVAELEREPPIA
jgi:hypothetical protein